MAKKVAMCNVMQVYYQEPEMLFGVSNSFHTESDLIKL